MENHAHISQLNNALVIPQTPHSDFGRKPMSRDHFISGVCQTKNSDIFFGHKYKNNYLLNKDLQLSTIKNSKSLKLQGTWLFGGLLAPHFGHFMAESCHRLWAWQSMATKVDGIIVLPPPGYSDINKWPAFIFDVYALFGIVKEDIKIITNLTEVEHIHIPEMGASFHGEIKSWYAEWLNGNPLYGEQSHIHQNRKLFISRRNYKLKGRVAGMDAVAELLAEQGFEEVYPEELSIKEQLLLLSSASHIIWEEGSAVHLMELLAKQNSRAALIMRRPKNPNIRNFLEKKYDNLYTDSSLVMDKLAQNRPNNALAYFANIIDTIKGLEQSGIISKTYDISRVKRLLVENEKIDSLEYVRSLRLSDEKRKLFLSRVKLFQKLRRLNLDKSHLIKYILFNDLPTNTVTPKDLREMSAFLAHPKIEETEKHEVAQSLKRATEQCSNKALQTKLKAIQALIS